MRLLERKFTYFLEIAKAGSLQKASQSLLLTQPALTAAIHRLEEELGIKLFQRHRHGLSLTDEGQRFHQWLANEEANLKLSFDKKYLAKQDIVRIGSAFFFLQEYLNPSMRSLKPDFKLQILSRPFNDLLRATELGYVDFAFVGWNGSPPTTVEHIRLFDCPCAIVGLKGHHDHIRNVDRMSGLEGESWVLEADWPNDKWLTLLRDRPGMLVNQHHLFKEYFLKGEGISEIEVHYFARNLQKKLVYSLVPSAFQDGWYGLIYRSSISEELLGIAKQLAHDITTLHRKQWPGLKNGSPLQIRNYIEKK